MELIFDEKDRQFKPFRNAGEATASTNRFLSFRYIVVLVLLLSVGLMSWLFSKKSELTVQLKSITRNAVIRPISLAPIQKSTKMSLDGTERDGIQGTIVASVQEAMKSTPKNDHVKQKNESKDTYAVGSSIARSLNRGFAIQVGAFRSLARAEKFQKALQDKGYDAYLETRALPDHGLIHRVRIQGYMSLVDAREEMERLHEEEGLDSFALPLEPELP
jgi:cell division septation protein DedD